MRPEIIDKYRQLTVESNRLKAEAEKLKPEVRKLIEETGGWNDCYLQRKETTEYHEEVIYDWLKTAYPQYVEELSKVTIDLEKFGNYVKMKKIPMSSLPDSLFSVKESFSLCTTLKKEKKDEDSTPEG